jgi:hypothetical protein
VGANADQAAPGPEIRSDPDPTRPAVSTTAAAERMKLSRYYITELVQRGDLHGYGVRRHEGGRVRWYVYEDALPRAAERTEGVRARFDARELLKHLHDARKHSLLARDKRGSAHQGLLDVADQLIDAVGAARDGDNSRVIDLLLKAHRALNEEERRLLKLQEYAEVVERDLEAAYWGLLPLREEVEHAKDDASFAFLEDSREPQTPDPHGSG